MNTSDGYSFRAFLRRYYVRVGEFVCKAYYEKEKAGFYDGGEKISGVTAWIASVIGLDAALHAGEYRKTAPGGGGVFLINV